MKSNEIYPILRSFSKSEITSFRKFLNSPYFGDNKKVVHMFDYISKYHPRFNNVNLTKCKISEAIYPASAYKDSTIRNLMSDLVKKALQFMSIENFNKNNLDKYNHLFNELTLKGLNDEFYKLVIKADKFRKEPIDWFYFLNYHFAETNKFNFSKQNLKFGRRQNLQSEITYMNNSLNHLTYFYVTEFISIYINYKHYKNSYNTSLYNRNLEEAVNLIDFGVLRKFLEGSEHLFVLELYEALMKMNTDTSDAKLYFKYRDLLQKNVERLSLDERKFNYFQLITYCTLKIFSESSDHDYNTELFSLYEMILENEYYLDRKLKYLSHELYRNILTHAIRTKRFKWCKMFIEKYRSKVHPNDRDNMFHYGSAYLKYNTGKTDEALEHIMKINIKYFVFKIDIKNLTLMIYCEKGYTEEALSLVKTQIESIRVNKLVHPERKKRYINFIKFTEKLILYNAGSLKQDIGFIKRKILANNSVAFKDWLLEKIEQASKPPPGSDTSKREHYRLSDRNMNR